MALDKATLKTDIMTLLEGLFNNSAGMTPAEARESFVNGLADAVEKYVKSADGIYQAGSLMAGQVAVTATKTAIKLQ